MTNSPQLLFEHSQQTTEQAGMWRELRPGLAYMAESLQSEPPNNPTGDLTTGQLRLQLPVMIDALQTTIHHTNEDDTRIRSKQVLRFLQRLQQTFGFERKG